MSRNPGTDPDIALRDDLVRHMDALAYPSEISIVVIRPEVRLPSDDGIWAKFAPGPKTYVAISGLSDRVGPYIEAIWKISQAELKK